MFGRASSTQLRTVISYLDDALLANNIHSVKALIQSAKAEVAKVVKDTATDTRSPSDEHRSTQALGPHGQGAKKTTTHHTTVKAKRPLPFLRRGPRRKPGSDQVLQVDELPGHCSSKRHRTNRASSEGIGATQSANSKTNAPTPRLRNGKQSEGLYEWEDVLDSRSGKVLVKWKGWSEPTWEPQTQEMRDFFEAKTNQQWHCLPTSPSSASAQREPTSKGTPVAVATPVAETSGPDRKSVV